MGCANGTLTAEEKAVAQLKFLFDSIDLDSDKTVDRKELQAALRKNDQLRALLSEAKFNPDSLDLEHLGTNKDGRVSWEEFQRQLKPAATEQVEKTGFVPAFEVAVEDKAEARLRGIFKAIDTNKDKTVSKEELATKLRAEEAEGLKTLLAEAGLNTNFDVLEQLGTDSHGRVTWEQFYGKLKEAAKGEVRETGDVTAAIEMKVEDDRTSTAASEGDEVKIEDEGCSKFIACC